MGCNVSREERVNMPPQLRKGKGFETDVKVSASDFVGTRKGKISDYYSFGKTLGTGAYGVVKKATHKKTGLTRAVKVLKKAYLSQEEQEKVMNEVEVLRNLDHPNIMKVIETYEDKKYYFIVTEFYEGGELFDKIVQSQHFTEKDAAKTMKQILSAVNHCHKNKIVHRDLKPENILLESKKADSIIKIIDFGTSSAYNPDKKLNQKFGTPYYIAPEVLKKRYDEKCDVWSCGVIMYILLCGFPPFNGKTDNEILQSVLKGHVSFKHAEFDTVSKEGKKFISRLLEYNTESRISAEDALSDPWFTKMLGNEKVDTTLNRNVLTNLKTFRADQKLQEATWVFLVTYLASQEEKSELLKTFQMLDANGDGKLTREEIIDGFQRILESENPEEDADAILRQLDNNNSGTIDYTEFVVATINRKTLLSKERLETAFKIFDQDGNGYLTADELREIFNPGNSKNVDDDVWTQWIREVDDNSDGRISLSEFKAMMMRLGK